MKNLHDKLISKAYNKWQKSEWSPKEFIENINFQEKTAVILGNLNYQVENGGFAQWKYNRYAKNHIFFIRSLLDKTDWSVTSKYPQLLKGLNLAIKAEKIEIDYDNEEDDNKNDRILDKLDDEYYSLKNITNEMNEYLESIKDF